jgi:hypothetical protein
VKITSVQLAKRVEKWQYALVELGVAHWRIIAVTLTDEMPNEDDADASVRVSSNYDSYHIFFRNEFIETTDEDRLDETIIHELLHVSMRDLDEALETAEAWMTPAGYNDWAHTVNHAREGHVERLARLIKRLYYDEKPRFSP